MSSDIKLLWPAGDGDIDLWPSFNIHIVIHQHSEYLHGLTLQFCDGNPSLIMAL